MTNAVPEQLEKKPTLGGKAARDALRASINGQQIEATIIQYSNEINQEIDRLAKSHSQNVDHYLGMIKFYYRQSFDSLALAYSQKSLNEEFALRAQEIKNNAMLQIRQAARENGGWLLDEGLTQLHRDSMKFKEILNNDPNGWIQDAFKYILNPKQEDRSKHLGEIQSSIIDLYGENQRQESKEIIFYFIANLTQADRTQLLNDLKDSNFPEKEKFAKEANEQGVLSLGDMEILVDHKYDPVQRQEFNDTYLKQEKKRVSLKGIRGRYGDRNIWDSVTPASIGLFLGDAMAFTNLSLNTGFAIASGQPLGALSNKWSQFSAAYLIGRHMSKSDKPISAQIENPATRISENARLKFSDLQSNTLAFEPWEAFFADVQNSPARLKAIRDFTATYLAKHKVKELPEKIAPNEFLDYLDENPEFKHLTPDFQAILKGDQVFSQICYVIQHFHFDKETEVIRNSTTFLQALNLIQEKY